MPKVRLDLYAECNIQGAREDEFTAQCCVVCLNAECTRSRSVDTKFQKRVDTWYEDMFSAVPRMTPDDPRFGSIAAKRFESVNPALTVSSSWGPPVWEEPATAAPPKEEASEVEVARSTSVEAPTLATDPIAPPESTPTPRPASLNTQPQANRMIPGAPTPTPTPKPGNVVKPGAVIKLGS